MKIILTNIIVFFFTLFFLINTPIVHASVIFEDNFENPLLSQQKWEISGPQLFNGDGTQANWKFENGVYGIKIINQGFQFNETIPKNWDNSIKNYSMEVDMKLVNGVDTNLVFRYQNHSNWYGVHGINNEGRLVLQKAGGTFSSLPTEKFFIFTPGTFYHFKIDVIGNNLKVFINNQLMWNIADNGTILTSGAPGLQAGTGATTSLEIQFDNFKITSIDSLPNDILNVPYFSQNVEPWGPKEYDHAKSLGFENTTINRWGCAVTSVAMVLRYHGINEMQDGTPINPESLNNWLKANNGYATGKGTDGTYSWIKFSSIPILVKNLFDAGKSSIKLMYKRAAATESTILNDDLINQKNPDILKVKNSSTNSHFVVAKGKLDTGYAINDPEWNYPDLSKFNNIFYQIDRFIPSNTNLSYLVFVINPSVDLVVTDSQGRKTGKQHVNGHVQEFNEIPNAIYSFEEPISNSNNQDIPEQLGVGTNVFLLPEPDDGEYSILTTSATPNTYTLNLSSYQANGDDSNSSFIETVGPNMQKETQIIYSQTTPSDIKNIITFESTINDIQNLRSLNEIKNEGISKALIVLIKEAQRSSEKGRNNLAKLSLSAFEVLIKTLQGKGITNNAYQILHTDALELKKRL